MKSLFTVLAMSVLLVASLGFVDPQASADGSGRWVCKTPPIWNGRARDVRYTSGSSRDQAYNQAAALCQHSGYAEQCVSQVTCWQE